MSTGRQSQKWKLRPGRRGEAVLTEAELELARPRRRLALVRLFSFPFPSAGDGDQRSASRHAGKERVSTVEREERERGRESAPDHMRNGVATTQGRTQNDSGRVRSPHCRWRKFSRGRHKRQDARGGWRVMGESRYIEIMCASAFGFQFSICTGPWDIPLTSNSSSNRPSPSCPPSPPFPLIPLKHLSIRQPVNQKLLRSLPHFLIYAGNVKSTPFCGCVCIVVGRTAHTHTHPYTHTLSHTLEVCGVAIDGCQCISRPKRNLPFDNNVCKVLACLVNRNDWIDRNWNPRQMQID